eukprot:314042-Amphidinium_carterae.1
MDRCTTLLSSCPKRTLCRTRPCSKRVSSVSLTKWTHAIPLLAIAPRHSSCTSASQSTSRTPRVRKSSTWSEIFRLSSSCAAPGWKIRSGSADTLPSNTIPRPACREAGIEGCPKTPETKYPRSILDAITPSLPSPISSCEPDNDGAST